MAEPKITPLPEFLQSDTTLREYLDLPPVSAPLTAPAPPPAPRPKASGFSLLENLPPVDAFSPVKYKAGEIPVRPGAGLAAKTLSSRTASPQAVSTALQILSPEDQIITAAEAERILEPKWWQSALLQLEPFDYARGLSWWLLAGAASVLPDADPEAGKAAQGFLGEGAAWAAELAYGKSETAQGVEELVRNIYKVAAAGTLYEKPRRFHGDGLPSWGGLFDTGMRLPNVTGDLILDYTLPVHEAKELAAKARKEGNNKTAFSLELLSDPLSRTILSIIPELILDPLWMLGPAKGASVFQKGGKVFLMGSRASEAARAVSHLDNAVTNHGAQRLILDFALGGDEAAAAAASLRNVADIGKARAATHAKEAARYTGKAEDPAGALVAAREELENTVKTLDEAIANYGKDLAKGETTGVRAAKLASIKKSRSNMQKEVEKLTGKNAKSRLAALSKRSESLQKFHNAQAASIERLLAMAPDRLAAQAQIKRGLSVHIPLFHKLPMVQKWGWDAQTSVGFKTMSLTPNLKLGDNAALIAERVGIQMEDLAELNGLRRDDLDGIRKMVKDGKRITVGLGSTGLRGFTKGVFQAPILNQVARGADWVSVAMSPARLNTIREKKLSELSAGEKIALYLDHGSVPGMTEGITKIPMALMDFLGRTIGTRWMQPWLASREMDKALMYFQSRGAGQQLLSNLGSRPRLWLRLRKTAPEIWNSYQKALGNYQMAIKTENQLIMDSVSRWAKMARQIAAKRMEDQPLIYARPGDEYNGSHVLNEMADILETGAGRLPDELVELRDAVNVFMKEFSDRTGEAFEEVQQSLIAISRFGQGDAKAYLALADEIAETLDLLRQAKKVDPAADELKAINESLEQVKSDEKAREKIGDVDKKLKEMRKKATSEFKKKALTAAAEAKKEDLRKQIESLKQIRNHLKKAKAEITAGTYSESLQKAIDTGAARITELEGRLSAQWAERVRTRPLPEPDGTLKEPILPAIKTDHYLRHMKEWETDLWATIQPVMANYSEEDRLRAILATMGDKEVFKRTPESMEKTSQAYKKLREAYVKQGLGKAVSPRPIPKDEQAKFERLQKKQLLLRRRIDKEKGTLPEKEYAKLESKLKEVTADLAAKEKKQFEGDVSILPEVVGERFTEKISPDIKPLVDEFRKTLDSYRQKYEEHGMDFMRDPLQRMKLWGVDAYVPHLRQDSLMPVTTDKTSDMLDSMKAGTLDVALSSEMDAGRHRSLSGTISEINESLKMPSKGQEENWRFTMDPNLLMARFFNSTKALKNQDFLWALNRGGVLRSFDDTEEAIRRGYVPLFERAVRHADYDRFLRVKDPKEWNIRDANGADKTEAFMEQLNAAHKAAKEKLAKGEKPKVSPLVSWANDITFLNNTRTAEHAIAGIKISQMKQLEKGQSPLVPMMDGELYNASKRWRVLREKHLQDFKTADEGKIIAQQEKIANYKKKIEEATSDKMTSHRQGLLATAEQALKDLEGKLNLSRRAARQEKMAGNLAWKDLTKEINGYVADINNMVGAGRKELFGTESSLPSLREGTVRIFAGEDEKGMLRLYIPQGVEESMRMMFSEAWLMNVPGVKKASRFLHKTNNWWKTRVTIMAIAFSTRNAIGNTFQNMMDIGMGGVLNPFTNWTAARVSQMADYWSSYGSMRNAWQEISKPKQAGETTGEYLNRFAAGQEMKRTGLYNPDKLNTVDLGDGVQREVDEAMALLHSRGVISGSDTFHADIDQVHDQFMELAQSLGYLEAGKVGWKRTKRAMSIGEDLIVLGAGPLSVASGGMLIPVGLPKKWGATMSRRFENQARMVNFIANMKRGGTVETAAEHANKFLMNYSDLTPTQKSWTRLFMPFFTWNQKNFLLTLDMMEKNPVYFSTFYRTVYDWLPRVAEAVQAEEKGMVTHAKLAEAKREDRIKYIPQYNLFKMRVPLDLSNNIWLEGLGVPLEGFHQQVAALGGLTVPIAAVLGSQEAKDAQLRSDILGGGESYTYALAQTHFLLRSVVELGLLKEYSYYQRDFKDARSRQVNDLASFAVHLQDSGIPPLQLMGTGIKSHLGMTLQAHSDGRLYYYIDADKIEEKYAIDQLPYMRIIRNAASLSDIYNTAMLTEAAKSKDPKGVATIKEIGKTWRAINALSGVKLKQDIPQDAAYRRHQYELLEILTGQSDLLGITYRGRIPRPKER